MTKLHENEKLCSCQEAPFKGKEKDALVIINSSRAAFHKQNLEPWKGVQSQCLCVALAKAT